MTPNSSHRPLTGTEASTDEGFARRRMNDVAGLAAILSTIFLVALVTGGDTPAFAIVMFGALAALVYGEQRLRGATPQHTAHHGAFTGRHVRA